MCSGSEAGSYLRLMDFMYHSTLGVRVMKRKKKDRMQPRNPAPETLNPKPETPNPTPRIAGNSGGPAIMNNEVLPHPLCIYILHSQHLTLCFEPPSYPKP